ncbi:MAG: ABC transporter [Clostridiales bacterium 38-18]|nr:MAG: ABC transporter [Clostridiales bacterium 38-18]
MTKLIKFLKPFTLLILLAVALLYGQAQADLALPDYMSNIVNIGIQSSGMDSATPEVFTASDLGNIMLFMSTDDREIVSAAYEPITHDQSEYADYADRYTKLNGADIYVLNKDKVTDADQLELIMSKNMVEIGAKMGGKEIDLTNLEDALIVQMGQDANIKYSENLGLDVAKIQKNYILKTGGIMLLISLLGALASITVGLIAARVAAGVGRNLRRAVFTKVESFSNAEFDKFSTASLITRSTNDITQIQTLMVMMIRMVFYAPLMGIGGVIKALDKSSHMSWIIAIAVIVLLGFIMVVFSIALPKFKAIQKMVDKLNLVVRENLTGMMVVRAFNTQSFEEDRFDKANQDLTKTNLFVGRTMSFMMPIMMLIMNGVTLTIVWIGAHQIADATMQVGDMMAFMQYAIQIIMSFLMLSMMFIMIPRASVSAGRVAEVLETELTILDPKQPKAINKNGKGEVEFKNVSFKFHGAEENMIKNVSFKAEAGKMTAIIGSTGSGKTTLINLIPRFYDVTEGQVLVDGVPVNEVKQSDLRAIIGYAPQKASLFSGTIKSNLLFADETASTASLEESLDIAQATEFVSEKPEGIDAPISQSGGNVSGGQKQRLSIARAIVKKPKIYIFDDTFSALDYKTDVALRSALKQKTDNATVILVAQRIATIKNADQILVLDEGKLVGVGTHTELMQSCSTYQEIALSQLSMEELA